MNRQLTDHELNVLQDTFNLTNEMKERARITYLCKLDTLIGRLKFLEVFKKEKPADVIQKDYEQLRRELCERSEGINLLV